MGDHSNILKWMEEAIKLEERGKLAYQKAEKEVEDPLAKDLFARLAELEDEHKKRIEEIYKKISVEKDWPAEIENHSKAKFAELKAKFKKPLKATPKEIKNAKAFEAARIGADFENAAANFYESCLKDATNKGERLFLEALRNEEKEHLAFLNELILYYSDPEAWMLEQAGASLDGA